MADLCAELTARVGVPVVDGVAAAVGVASGMVRMGLRTSKRDEYAVPPVRVLSGFGADSSLWGGGITPQTANRAPNAATTAADAVASPTPDDPSTGRVFA